MEKYFLITTRNPSGNTITFIEKSYSLYSAFLLKKKLSDTIPNHINNNSIIFSQEVTKTDYELYQKHQKV